MDKQSTKTVSVEFLLGTGHKDGPVSSCGMSSSRDVMEVEVVVCVPVEGRDLQRAMT